MNITKWIPDWADIEYDSMTDSYIPLGIVFVIIVLVYHIDHGVRVWLKNNKGRGCVWRVKRRARKIKRFLEKGEILNLIFIILFSIIVILICIAPFLLLM